MGDDDYLVQSANFKGRSASVCYPGPLPRPNDHFRGTAGNSGNYSPPITPPSITGDFKQSKNVAIRTHSARSIRKKFQFVETEGYDGQCVNFANSESRNGGEPGGSGTSSPVALRRKGSQRRSNSVYQHSHSQRKSAAYLDIPKNSIISSHEPPPPPDENSYRLRSFSYTSKGIINRGDSFRRKHGRSNSIMLPSGAIGTSMAHDSLPSSETTRNSIDTESRLINSDDLVTIAYNVIVMGAKGVGKTSLISQFMTSEAINAYDRQNNPPSEQTVSIMLNGIESELCFHELKNSKSLYQNKVQADAFLVIYSIGDKTSFQKAEAELTRLQDTDFLVTRPAILVGNKIDLARSRAVSLQDGKCLACTFRVKFMEISVGINHNVDELLVGILNQIRLKKQHVDHEPLNNSTWYKGRGIIRATMKARQMFTWIFGKEDSKFKNCENLNIL